MKRVPMEQWSKDHWSLLAYVETCCVDSRQGGIGELNWRRMRCYLPNYPLLGDGMYQDATEWIPEWGTRLRGFFETQKKGEDTSSWLLPKHCDWACLEDLEAAGLAKIMSLVNGFVRMTEQGMAVAGQLRSHKAQGGVFATFVPKKRGG